MKQQIEVVEGHPVLGIVFSSNNECLSTTQLSESIAQFMLSTNSSPAGVMYE